MIHAHTHIYIYIHALIPAVSLLLNLWRLHPLSETNWQSLAKWIMSVCFQSTPWGQQQFSPGIWYCIPPFSIENWKRKHPFTDHSQRFAPILTLHLDSFRQYLANLVGSRSDILTLAEGTEAPADHGGFVSSIWPLLGLEIHSTSKRQQHDVELKTSTIWCCVDWYLMVFNVGINGLLSLLLAFHVSKQISI